MENEEHRLDLSSDLYVIKNDPTSDIPAVELDRHINSYNILVFTSEKTAHRYCYLRTPDNIGNIVKLTKKEFYGELIQSGLLRIAYIVKHNYKNIKFFVFDHPGVKGDAQYASINEVLSLGKLSKNKKIKEKNELKDFVNIQE